MIGLGVFMLRETTVHRPDRDEIFGVRTITGLLFTISGGRKPGSKFAITMLPRRGWCLMAMDIFSCCVS